jgi:hypothetical protein
LNAPPLWNGNGFKGDFWIGFLRLESRNPTELPKSEPCFLGAILGLVACRIDDKRKF